VDLNRITCVVNLHDLRSAWRVRFRSLGVVRVPGALVAVLTRDSSISSSPSVNCSSLWRVIGERSCSARRLRQVSVPSAWSALDVSKSFLEHLINKYNLFIMKE